MSESLKKQSSRISMPAVDAHGNWLPKQEIARILGISLASIATENTKYRRAYVFFPPSDVTVLTESQLKTEQIMRGDVVLIYIFYPNRQRGYTVISPVALS